MASILEQVVLLNDEPPTSRLCFVCGLLLKCKERKIVDTKTNCSHVPLPNKLSNLVGNDFCILVSKFDEICHECLLIINEVDELECNLESARKKILSLLDAKYNLSLIVNDEGTLKKDLNLGQTEEIEVEQNMISFDETSELDFNNESKVELCLDILTDCDSSIIKCEELQVDTYRETNTSEVSVTTSLDSGQFYNLGPSKGVTKELLCDYCCGSYYCQEELNEHIKKNHSVKENIDKDLSCNVCSSYFHNTAELNLHTEKCHDSSFKGSKDVLCEYCCSSFYSVEELNDHTEKCHCPSNESIDPVLNGDSEVFIDNSNRDECETGVSNIIFKCGVCDFSDSDRAIVMKHLQSAHKIVCEICSAPFEKASELLDHYMSHGKNEPVCICKICEIPFPNKAVLARHLMVHKRSEGPITCQICGKICHDNLHAMYHRRNEHSIIQDLSCGLCNSPMESNVQLKHHLLIMHRGKKEYKCKECNKTFTRQLQYENHKAYAHGNSQCRVCGKHIANIVKLRQHEHRHARAETKKFECDVCHKIFKTQGGLKVHSVSHTGKYKFFCEFCGRGFMSSVILEEHKGVHTKEERYVCDICGRKFVLYSTFHLHKQWHIDPYPFPCKMCGRKFRYRSERSNHVRRDHTGETPYKCDHCFAAFMKLGYLKKHLTTHTKIHPHTCNLCDKGYYQKRALARHYAKVHNDPTLLQSFPKTCQYKVALRPEEYPEVDND